MRKKNIDAGPVGYAGHEPAKPAPAEAAQPGVAQPRAADQFLSTLSLVCRIPLPFTFTFSARRMDLWLPVTALFQSLLFILGLGFFWALLRDLNLALVSGLILLYGAFNLFHFDGLLDTADAFLGAFDRDKRFAILKDPRLGVYGVFTAFMYLALILMILQSLFGRFFTLLAPAQEGLSRLVITKNLNPFKLLQNPGLLLFSLLLFPLAGKTAAALIPARFPPAKQEGLGALAAGSRPGFVLLGFLLALGIYFLFFFGASEVVFSAAGLTSSAALTGADKALHIAQTGQIMALPLAQLGLTIGLTGILLFLSALMTSSFLGRLYKKGLGGYTGDTLGAAVELGDLVYLAFLLILVQWGL
jgi:adenosylcobinamide-GDP ribazoletransferase